MMQSLALLTATISEFVQNMEQWCWVARGPAPLPTRTGNARPAQQHKSTHVCTHTTHALACSLHFCGATAWRRAVSYGCPMLLHLPL